MPKHRFPALLLAAFLLQPAALWAEEPQPPAAGSSATVSVEQLRDLAGQVASAKNWKAVVEYASRLLAQQPDGLPSLLAAIPPLTGDPGISARRRAPGLGDEPQQPGVAVPGAGPVCGGRAALPPRLPYRPQRRRAPARLDRPGQPVRPEHPIDFWSSTFRPEASRQITPRSAPPGTLRSLRAALPGVRAPGTHRSAIRGAGRNG